MNEKQLESYVDLERSRNNNKRPDVWGSILFFSELICFMSFINLPIENVTFTGCAHYLFYFIL